MTGFRIEIDVAGLVHQQWWRMSWKHRWLWLVPGARKRIEAEAVRRMTT